MFLNALADVLVKVYLLCQFSLDQQQFLGLYNLLAFYLFVSQENRLLLDPQLSLPPRTFSSLTLSLQILGSQHGT